ncbi:MAG TPA: alkaline phosphatase family protein [Kofleriaceae bacterium]|nr:alkaline phosphatase family protein [Kofleriaceae bacterium]
MKHVIVVMMENHSFDNYFGALPYAPASPYHRPGGARTSCRDDDHRCVDGLSCTVDAAGGFACSNANLDDDGSTVFAFHDPNRCVQPDLNHEWTGVHREVNFAQPSDTRDHPVMDGFVRVNDETEQTDDGGESPTEDETMGFYTQAEIPFYYDLAQHFAISDRFFSPMLGPTFPNRAYFLAATSFGHVVTSDQIPPGDGYQPISGTIFDLLDRNDVSWADYFTDVPQGASFRPFGATLIDPHFLPVAVFLAQAAGLPGIGDLPAVSFVDPGFGLLGTTTESDEHPPTDIQRGQAFVSQVVNAVRNGPSWNDSVIFIVYDEHGGFYDHVPPPPAVAPDPIQPGQCADLSNPPASLSPGGGAECSDNLEGDPNTSVVEATRLCPALAADPTGPYPAGCARFDQLGARVPFIAVSPFARPQYVSHRVADHTSILAFIETAFLPSTHARRQHLTERDRHADNLLDLFDFGRAPSRDTPVGAAAPPLDDCTPLL